MRLIGWSAMWVMTYLRYRSGLMPFSLAVPSSE